MTNNTKPTPSIGEWEGKKCSSCKEFKEFFKFNKNITNKDGLAYDCKDCHREQQKKWRDRNRDSYKLSRDKWFDIYRSKNESKISAQKKLRKKVWSGAIKKSPCGICGSKENIHGHHYRGYEYPLDVMWLCPLHHSLTDAYIKQLICKELLRIQKSIEELPHTANLVLREQVLSLLTPKDTEEEK